MRVSGNSHTVRPDVVSTRTSLVVAISITYLRFWIPDIEWGGCSCSSVSDLVLSIGGRAEIVWTNGGRVASSSSGSLVICV